MQVTRRIPTTDEEGYLVEPLEWTEKQAETLARQEGIELTEDHWDVIRFIRAYYREHQVAPDARFVVEHLAQRPGAVSRNRLFALFPYGYVRQACKIAGMKRQRAWSTG